METKKIARCEWCGNDPLYVAYHDEEWGRPLRDDRKLFEKLTLDSAQAGLSWITILRRREGYRKAFEGFDPLKVARMTEADVERLVQDTGIIRHRGKIESAISNARLFLEIQQEFGSFAEYITGFLPDGAPVVNYPKSVREIPATSPLSDAISKDMKKRGFRFFGSTICYAFLQAAGFVDDHVVGCHCKTEKKP